jgi:hypothetical protein
MFETGTINISGLGLPEADRPKLNRCLKATRSTLLFSPRAAWREVHAPALRGVSAWPARKPVARQTERGVRPWC